MYLEEQLKATHPFTPYIYMSNAVQRELTRETAFARLTNTDVKKEMQKVLAKIKLELATRECTFQPRINSNPPGGYYVETDDEGRVLPVEQRLSAKQDRAKEKTAKLKQAILAREAREVTLKPKLPTKSSILAERCYRRKNMVDLGGSLSVIGSSQEKDRDAVFSRIHNQPLGSRLEHKISRSMETYIFDRDDCIDDLIDSFNESNPLQEFNPSTCRSQPLSPLSSSPCTSPPHTPPYFPPGSRSRSNSRRETTSSSFSSSTSSHGRTRSGSAHSQRRSR